MQTGGKRKHQLPRRLSSCQPPVLLALLQQLESHQHCLCPLRVTAEIRRSPNEFLTAGLAFDIVVNDPDDGRPWDFSVLAKREKAREILGKQRPYVLIGSPMCTAFSTWQFLNVARRSNTAAAEAAKAKAIQHMNFAASL